MAEPEAKQILIYRGRRYDVSGWIDRHPGGAILRAFLGQDATCVMHMFHDMRHKGTQKILAKMDIGEAPDHPLSAFDSDYLALEQMFLERGWFKPSAAWYTYKTVLLLGLLLTAFLVPGPWLKGLFFGLFIQQSAFLGHDVHHDAVTPRRHRRLAAWFYGVVGFGLNHDKWLHEHNIHHALVGRPFEDPQLNTMPHLLYAWREVEAFEKRKGRSVTGWEKFKMGFQHIWLLPVLLLYGRINMSKTDVKNAFKQRSRHYLSGYALHFGLWLALIAQGWRTPIYHTVVFVLITLAVSGIIHLQLIVSHAYAPRLFEDEQKRVGMKLQAICNQNITTSFLDDWFHGGLQHHIEHHLFPRLPRHSLPKVRPHVRALCEKHGLPYRSDPFLIAARDFLRSLRDQGAPFRAQLAEQRRLRRA
jgi:acyl-lipid Delta6-acetylenase / acyl-lipid (9-3)-desaturase